ncbi:ABC transporter ATP-binding protein [Gordonia sp. NB41Y]|uniref:ABC transporter ATP-binding protein n=1 Tax=Gordonia sp. NB41Y TaxID=875808 RepID=UPI00273AD239|nr:ABC transporter ATP-binding protein [Gordonia sp. NB41Y]WLP90015.1 ABC transporter ATP-binding protein [Gordonia sp. NB41Y]
MLETDRLRVAYGSDVVIDDLTWAAGGTDSLVTALLGPSGCGKSTLIRAVAGLERPAAGAIRFAGQDLAPIPAHRRDFGVVFQDGQLFTGRTVAANIAYGLRIRRRSRAEIAARIDELLELVHLPGMQSRRVDELSGGQAQRVALARALAPRPRLLLLDEPLAALDRRLRDSLAIEIAEIVRATGTPTIVVTHDHGEAALMADSISVMREGAIVQTARPGTLWAAPADEWTARFLGCATVIDARRDADGTVHTDLGPVAIDLPGTMARLGLRAESVAVQPVTDHDGGVTGTVLAVADLPTGARLRVASPIGEIDASASGSVALGDRVGLRLVPERVAVVGR